MTKPTKTPAKKCKGMRDGEEAGSMSASDVKFLVGCLQNTTGGYVTVDIIKAADALGYQNIRSITNRLATIKKKYNLPIGSTSKSPAPTTSVDNVDFPSFDTPAKTTAAKSPAAPPKTPKTKAYTSRKSPVKEFDVPGEKADGPAATRTTRTKKRKLDEDETSDEATGGEGPGQAVGEGSGQATGEGSAQAAGDTVKIDIKTKADTNTKAGTKSKANDTTEDEA